LVMLIRLPLSEKLCDTDGRNSIFFALYLLPGLVLVHVVLGGLIYYAFPYIILVTSVTLDIILFIYYKKKLFGKPRLVTHLIGRYILSVYAIICLLVFFDSAWPFVVLAVVLPALPTILYVIVQKLLDRVP